MKKPILIICLSLVLTISGLITAAAQEQPKPQKDTVNLDTQAKPEQYYSTEDEKSEAGTGTEKSSAGTIGIILGAVVVVGGAAFFLLKKKK